MSRRGYDASRMKVTLLGHASVYIEMDGARCLMDPVFQDPFEDTAVVSCPRRSICPRPDSGGRLSGHLARPSGPLRRPLARARRENVPQVPRPLSKGQGDRLRARAAGLPQRPSRRADEALSLAEARTAHDALERVERDRVRCDLQGSQRHLLEIRSTRSSRHRSSLAASSGWAAVSI